MKNIKNIVCIIFLLASLSGCKKDFLERSPLDKISSLVFFKTTSDLRIYVNQFYKPGLLDYGGSGGLNYSKLIFNADLNSDNYIGPNINVVLNGSRVIPASGGGWDYSNVRSVNYFFENYRKCQDDFDSYKQYVGEAHFFRALIYYQLVQRFGDVLYYDKTLQTNSEELFASRTPRNIVVDKIIKDLDTAAMYMTADRNEGGIRLDKWCALALQSRVALYEGTWEKYHAGSPFGVASPDPDKYFNKVIEATNAIMNSGKFEIYNTGDIQNDYYNFFNIHDYSGNKEVIFWKKFDKALGIVNYRMVSGRYPSGTGITKALADSYLCTDGKPVSVSPDFGGYTSIYTEMQNRDPRYRQTIFTPDAPYRTDATKNLSWGTEVFANLYSNSEHSSTTGYVMRKGYNHDLATHNLAGEDEPIIFYSYAEVLLNFAEAKAELGIIAQADIDKSIKLLRDRVGMPNLFVASIVNDPKWEFPVLSPIINEVRRERRVELSVTGFRWDDIARWAAADELIAGKRPKGIMYGSQFPGNPYKNDASGFMDPYQVPLPSGYGFKIDRDYLYPLPINEITLNNKLKQNPGWIN